MYLVSLESSGQEVEPQYLGVTNFSNSYNHSKSGLAEDSRARCYMPLNMVHQTEPRIASVAHSLSALLSSIQLKDEFGAKIPVDGFRLKPLKAWRTRIRPGDTEPIEHYLASGVCNVACEFCYEFGTPKELRTPKQRVSLSELNTRLKYYEPENGRALFDIFHQYYDAFSHPDCISILHKIRQKTNGILDLITNGRTLTEDVVKELRALRPLQLTISLNSADPGKRKIVMRDKTPEIAARSLPILKKYNIPFGIVIVPWPPLIDENDMEVTIRYIEQFNPNFVSVSLPGYTDFLPNVPEQLDEEFHRKIVAKIRELRKLYKTPLLIQPRLAEAEWYEEEHEAPFILGTMPDTPAREADLQYGDIITSINEKKVQWAYDAHRFIELMELYGDGEISMRVLRNGTHLSYKLKIPLDAKDNGRGYGLIIGHGIRPKSLDRIVEMARSQHEIWVLSSKWMLKSVTRMLCKKLNAETLPGNLKIKVVPCTYFGGNISLGDLLTLSDYEVFIEKELRTNHPNPKKIFIPSSPFSDWGKDLKGQNKYTLNRLFGNKIEFVDCNRIMV